jgi:AsmA-like protein/uncharacterized protein DUF3971
MPRVAKIAAVIAFLLLAGFGLLYVRLLQGPIALQFLVQPIERAIAEEASAVGVEIEGVAIRLGEGGHIEFELKNVRIVDAGKTPLALAPSASISLSRKALLRGRIAAESVDLNSPRLSLFHSDDGVLSLKFSHPAEASESERAKPPALRGPTEALPAGDGEGALGRIDLIKALSDASAVARRRERASAYLRSIGLRSATVVIDNGTRKSIWRVPELDIDLDHRRSRSSIAGRAKIDSLAGPWTINFRTYEQENSKTLQLAVSVQGLVPRGLARALPQLAGLESLDVPVWGDARLELSNTGEILSGAIGIDAAPGQVLLPWLAPTPLRIDGGHLAMSYSRAARRFEIEPSVLVWGDSRMQFTGSLTQAQQGPDGPGWAFEFKSAGGWLGAEPPHLQQLAIDDWSARGLFFPEQGRVALSHFGLRTGGGEILAQGDVTDMAGAMKARLDGKIGPMPASVFKTLWPTALAPRTRDWVIQHLARGWLQGGTFRLASGSENSGVWTATTSADRGSLTLEGANLAFALVDSWPVLEAPRALVRLDAQTFEMTAPDASFALSDGRRLAVKGTLTVDMTEPPVARTGRVSARVQGPLAVPLDMLGREPFNALQGSGVNLANMDGKLEGQLTLAMPLGRPLTAADVKVEGKVRVSEGRLRHAVGAFDVTAANIAIDMTDAAVEASGEMLINGVPAKGSWQQVFGTAPDKQPPMKLAMRLDDSDRTQLGLDINDLVLGEVGLDVTAVRDAQGERQVHVRADLANAELVLDSIAWRKPKGRSGLFEFDVVKGAGPYPIELHNVKMDGDNVAIEGWMGVGADNKVKEYKFPHFSLNIVSRLEAQGKVRPDGVWEVTAKGPTFDGRDIFRSFFDVGRQLDPNAKVRPGLDLRAEISTVVGFSESALRNVKISLQKRSNKLVALDARGTLDGGKPFSAVLQPTPGQPRRLLADAGDAGQIFKLVGFYPNARGGVMNLEVNLDGHGAAERTGTLWARKFHVLGDPIVSEVLQNAEGGQTPTRGSRRTGDRQERQQFDFEIMRVPFEVGHGQFVMNNAVLNGPLEGATMRGRVDFRAQTIDIGGTYVGGTGLMQALAPIPLIGPLLTGPRGEGILGITYGIKGSMAKPQVIVNPLSLLTPGILREIFQMTPEDPRVQPRPLPKAIGPRSSSAPATSSGTREETGQAGMGSSWSAETGTRPK